MKKGLILLACFVSLLVLLLCACGDNTGNDGHDHDHENEGNGTTQSSGGTSSSGTQSGTGTSNNNENTDISSPETDCKLNESGHYWSEVSLNKNTSATGTVAISGKCEYCGDSLYKISTALVDYNEWKTALSTESMASFTEILSSGEYTDYDESGSIRWRIDENGTYTADYFINSMEKSSGTYAQRFYGFALQYDDFKYDSVSKTYVYWINVNSYIELGFADGALISHSTCSIKDGKETKNTTLYLNHGRVNVECPEFVEEKFENALSLEVLLSSNLSESLANGIYDELSKLDFNGSLEASLLENDRVSVYFYLENPGKCPISGEDYLTVSVIITDGYITSVSFGNNTTTVSLTGTKPFCLGTINP